MNTDNDTLKDPDQVTDVESEGEGEGDDDDKTLGTDEPGMARGGDSMASFSEGQVDASDLRQKFVHLHL